jgi:hypothetical protein
MNYKDMRIEDIIKWCQENKQVDWLKEIAAKQVEYKVYPRVKGEDGKYHTDKKATPTIEKRPISFIQLKLEFVKKFMPDIAPKAQPKKPSMYDLIKNL